MAMTPPDLLEALLDLVDPSRTPAKEASERLVMLGYAQRSGRTAYRPTTAGWNLLGDRGRPFEP